MMLIVRVLQLLLFFCWGLSSPHTTLSYAAVYYVTPHSPNPDCPSREPCLTINEYAQGNHFDGDDNITLFFLNGEHNLTYRNLEIDNKTTLKMVPLSSISKVEIQFGTAIMLRNIHKVDIAGLNFHTFNDSVPVCFSLIDIQHLSLNELSTKSCWLLFEGKMNAAVNRLLFINCSIYLNSGDSDQIVSIKETNFYSSILNISGDSGSTEGTISSAFMLDSCQMNESLLTIKLATKVIYRLSIFNTYVSSKNCTFSETGLKAEAFNTSTLYAMIRNCSIVGNSQGINVTLRGNSHVELTVDRCNITENGNATDQAGGVTVLQADKNTATVITDIIATLLSGNMFAQIEITCNSGYIATTVVDSTIQETTIEESKNKRTEYVGTGIGFVVGSGSDWNVMNLINNLFKDNSVAVSISGGQKCKFQLYFHGNSITSSHQWRKIDTIGLFFMGDTIEGKVDIANCVFENNTGTIIDLSTTVGQITIKDSIFQNNAGACLLAQSTQSKSTKINLKNVTVSSNKNTIPNTGIIQVDTNANLNIEDGCVFKQNRGSVIQAYSTSVQLSGTVTFQDNNALKGSAIFLSCSMLKLQSLNNTNTNVSILNNIAKDVGGGIYYNCPFTGDNDFYTRSSCFFDVKGVTVDELKHSKVNITLTFTGNLATNGGTDVFGVTPNSMCILVHENVPAFEVQKYIFKTSSKSSSISSDPKRVCLCDSSSQLMCANFSHIFYNTTRYPGEEFTISLAVVGFEFGTVTGFVYADLLPQANNSMSSLGRDQQQRQISCKAQNPCTKLSFAINSLKLWETIILTADDNMISNVENSSIIQALIHDYTDKEYYNMIPFDLLTVPVYINVSLSDCPPGFYRTSKGRCECIQTLKDIGITNCSIYNSIPYVTRTGNQWVCGQNESISHVLYSKYCPFDYCNHTMMRLNLWDPDEQCTLSRTGILCGGCPPNLSLVIGSSRCLECSDNYHILLVIAFAAAGVLLVLLIKILDMTVTTGTINGLLFYANIIWANQSVLFPPENKTSYLLRFLKTFIAWLNLDLGIETCFIHGLDGYWNTWLQFVFPAYIWLIAGLIILVSRRVTVILGNNSVHVLNTLFLLAYAKLLRTILVILDFTALALHPGNQTTEIVWSFDGNIPYFGTKHSILLAVAVVILLVLWLPYTFILLFIQVLRRYSHPYFLSWVSKLKPVFDSYTGSLKDKHQYWIGLGLLARLVLILNSTITLTTVPFISALLTTLITFLLGILVLNVYKKKLLGLLEGCFLINLVIFSAGTLYIEAQGGSKDYLACTSIMITFILFLAIIGYHLWRTFQNKQQESRRRPYAKIDGTSEQHRHLQRHQTSNDSESQSREPLLEPQEQLVESVH